MCHSASHALASAVPLHCIYHTRFTIKERHTSPNELLLHGKNAEPMALGSLLASCSVSTSVHTQAYGRRLDLQHSALSFLIASGIPSRCLGLLPLAASVAASSRHCLLQHA